jgi:hypothetical protein
MAVQGLDQKHNRGWDAGIDRGDMDKQSQATMCSEQRDELTAHEVDEQPGLSSEIPIQDIHNPRD